MTRAARIRGRIDGDPLLARDRGVSFIELMVAIVLLGMCVLATLVALRATTSATITDREHADAMAWLQAGADEVYKAPSVGCPAPAGAYGAAVALADPPSEWSGGAIEVVTVQFLAQNSGVYSWGTTCDPDYKAQKVTIRVTSPDGMVKTLDMVKDGS